MECRVLAMIFWSPGNGDESEKKPLKVALYRAENETGGLDTEDRKGSEDLKLT